MRNRHVTLRNVARLWLGLGALCCVSLARSADVGVSDFERLTVRTTGANTVAVTMGNPTGATNAVRVASTPSQMLSNVGNWMNYHTWGGGSVSGGVRVGQSGYVNVAGTRVPVTVATPISRAAMAEGMGILVRNAARVSGPVGLALMLADFAAGWDSSKLRVNEDPATRDTQPFLVPKQTLQCDISSVNQAAYQSWITQQGSPPGTQCPRQVRAATLQGPTVSKNGVNVPAGQCSVGVLWSTFTMSNGSCAPVYTDGFEGYQVVPSAVVPAEWEATNWDGARPAYEGMDMNAQELSKQMNEARRQAAASNGIEPWKVATGAAVLTAPSSLPDVVKTDTKTSGSTQTTTTTTTSTGITTTGDTVKVTPTTTTTTTTRTTNPDGSVTENTTTETTTTESNEDPTTKPSEDSPGLCDLYPDILACAKPELDTPEDEIPRTEKTVTYQAENVFGDGSCPADVVVQQSAGRSLTFSYAPICGPIQTYVRPAIIALALFGAYLIILPGGWRQS